MIDHRITIGDVLAGGALDRALVERAAVEQSLGYTAMAISLCTEGCLHDVARTDAGLGARLIMRHIDARRLDRELRALDPSSDAAASLHRGAVALINGLGDELIARGLVDRAVASTSLMSLLRSVDGEASELVSGIMRDNGVEHWAFSTRHYLSIVDD